MERASTRQHTERVIDALSQEQRELSRPDWAAWDDIYRYVNDLNQGYKNSNLVSGTFASMDVEFLGIYNVEGRQVWAGWRNPGTHELTSLPKPLQGAPWSRFLFVQAHGRQESHSWPSCLAKRRVDCRFPPDRKE